MRNLFSFLGLNSQTQLHLYTTQPVPHFTHLPRHPMSPQPPQIIRIKRKRGNDPLQALILEGSPRKRSRRSDQPPFYFALSRTDDTAPPSDLPVLSETDQNHFVLDCNVPTLQSPPPINPTLLQMVEDLHMDASPAPRRRRKSTVRDASSASAPVLDSPYVYDVYTLTSAEPPLSHEAPQIGYIRLFTGDDALDSGPDSPEPSDDEDSNAEDFYQNDYPSDEDAGGILFDEDEPDDDEDDDDEGNGRDSGFQLDFGYDFDDALERLDMTSSLYRDRILGNLQDLIDKE